MVQTEAYLTIVIYDRKNFIVLATAVYITTVSTTVEVKQTAQI